MTTQVNVIFKNLVISGLAVFVCLGSCLLIFERFRYFFAVVCFLFGLRYICIQIAITFLIPLLMRGKRIKNVNKAVLITGCDTGFGNLLAKRLDKIGFHVFAGCLNPDANGGAGLVTACSSRIKVFKLDVSDIKSVDDAKVFVESKLGDLELWAVVNNAGIGITTSFEIIGVKEFEKMVSVNFLGVTRVTREFLPFLRKSKGRLINVASLAGRSVNPGAPAYTVSKNAVIVFSDLMRMELYPFDVSVVTIEPSFYRTRIVDLKAIEEYIDGSWASSSTEIQSAYQISDLKKDFAFFRRVLSRHVSENLMEVVNDMESAVMDRVPQFHYSPGGWSLHLFSWFVNTFETEPPRNFFFCFFAKLIRSGGGR